jgi:hypothetical protein
MFRYNFSNQGDIQIYMSKLDQYSIDQKIEIKSLPSDNDIEYIIIEGPIYENKCMRTIESLSHPSWNEIPSRTPILFKNFIINLSEKNSILCGEYLLERFGPKTIADCIIVQDMLCDNHNSDGDVEGQSLMHKTIGHGCCFKGMILNLFAKNTKI